jgi:hypothetical protein
MARADFHYNRLCQAGKRRELTASAREEMLDVHFRAAIRDRNRLYQNDD